MFIIEAILNLPESYPFGINRISPLVLLKLGGNNPLLVKYGQAHRLLLSTVLHSGIVHWLANTLSLLIFCAQIEAMCAFKLFIPVFIIAGVQGNMLFDLVHKIIGHWASLYVGSTPCICGAIGLLIAKIVVMYKKGEELKLLKWKILAMIICLAALLLVPEINIFGAIGGLASGVLIGLTILSWGDPDLGKFQMMGAVILAIYSVILCAIWI